MFKVLEGSGGNALGVEISGGYTKSDVEEFEKAFESHAAEGGRVNVLVKIDEVKLADSEFGAFWEDSRYALRNMDKLGHIAVVGHSQFEKILVKMDNLGFGSRAKDREEKYFDVSEMDRAWEFIRG